jgi:hypothetical protein
VGRGTLTRFIGHRVNCGKDMVLSSGCRYGGGKWERRRGPTAFEGRR